MKRVVRIGAATVLAGALFIAGGIGLFRTNGDGANAQTPPSASRARSTGGNAATRWLGARCS